VLEQRAHRVVRAVALVLKGQVARARECRQRREDVRELGSHAVVEGGESLWPETLDVFVQRIDKEREWQVVLELRRRA
jgi:hypothetical protein